MKFLYLLLVVSCLGCSGSDNCGESLDDQRARLQERTPVRHQALIDSTHLIAHLRFLSSDSLAGRFPGTAGSTLAQEHIIRQFQQYQLQPFLHDYRQAFSYTIKEGKTLEGANVIGMMKGNVYPDKYIVVSAHYDHLGTKGDEVFNGADDNASGVAALLSMLEYFSEHQPEHSLVFAFFDGEEQGLRGSSHFVKNLPVDSTAITLNVNMDMIGRNDKNDEVVVSGTYHFPELKPLLKPLQDATSIALLYGHDQPLPCSLQADDWTFASDHYSFYKQGIRYLYIGVEDSEDYHKATDTFEKIDKSFYYRLSNTLTRMLITLDEALE